MSTIRMRAMIRRLNVDEPKYASAPFGLDFTATQVCRACQNKADCVSWLDDEANNERPTFCPNLKRFEPYIAQRINLNRARPWINHGDGG